MEGEQIEGRRAVDDALMSDDGVDTSAASRRRAGRGRQRSESTEEIEGRRADDHGRRFSLQRFFFFFEENQPV